MQRMRSRSKKCDWISLAAFLEMRTFLENHSLEFHKIWQENTKGNKKVNYLKKI